MSCSAEIRQLLQLRRPFVIAERTFREEARTICTVYAGNRYKGRRLFKRYLTGAEVAPELGMALSLISAELERLATSPSLKHIDDALALAGNKHIDRHAAEERLGRTVASLCREARLIAESGSLSFNVRNTGEVVYFHTDQLDRALQEHKARRKPPRLYIRKGYPNSNGRKGIPRPLLDPAVYMSTARLIKTLGMKEKTYNHARSGRGMYQSLPFWPQPIAKKGNGYYFAVADVDRFMLWLHGEQQKVADGVYLGFADACAFIGLARGRHARHWLNTIPVVFRDPRNQRCYYLTTDIERLRAERMAEAMMRQPRIGVFSVGIR